jgi:hypothetical protein
MQATQVKCVRIKKANSVRGITYLGYGQQYSGWLPKGDYEHMGEVTLNYTDLGQSRSSQAIALRKLIGGEPWYIGTDAANDLPEVVVDMAPVGSRWRTEAGTFWDVIAVNDDYRTVERLDGAGRRTGDTYNWHAKSLTETTAKRMK